MCATVILRLKISPIFKLIPVSPVNPGILSKVFTSRTPSLQCQSSGELLFAPRGEATAALHIIATIHARSRTADHQQPSHRGSVLSPGNSTVLPAKPHRQSISTRDRKYRPLLLARDRPAVTAPHQQYA